MISYFSVTSKAHSRITATSFYVQALKSWLYGMPDQSGLEQLIEAMTGAEHARRPAARDVVMQVYNTCTQQPCTYCMAWLPVIGIYPPPSARLYPNLRSLEHRSKHLEPDRPRSSELLRRPSSRRQERQSLSESPHAGKTYKGDELHSRRDAHSAAPEDDSRPPLRRSAYSAFVESSRQPRPRRKADSALNEHPERLGSYPDEIVNSGTPAPQDNPGPFESQSRLPSSSKTGSDQRVRGRFLGTKRDARSKLRIDQDSDESERPKTPQKEPDGTRSKDDVARERLLEELNESRKKSGLPMVTWGKSGSNPQHLEDLFALS
jgi:hypothetical protein